jgi:hypothetical protein
MIRKDLIYEIISTGIVRWQKHALQRMMEREISRSDVKKAIIEGAVIESYIDDKPFPSVLIAHVNREVPIHVVAAFDSDNKTCYIITAYIPDGKYFENDLLTRRK